VDPIQGVRDGFIHHKIVFGDSFAIHCLTFVPESHRYACPMSILSIRREVGIVLHVLRFGLPGSFELPGRFITLALQLQVLKSEFYPGVSRRIQWLYRHSLEEISTRI
jgi:hypothetical protein